MRFSAQGYTLVELLVVISITAIISLVTFVNLGSFREDESLKQSSFALQTNLRTTQSNATSNRQCNGNSVKYWKAKFIKVGEQYKLETRCEYDYSVGVIPPGCVKVENQVECLVSSYSLESSNVIGKISSRHCESTDLSTSPVMIVFAPLSGRAKFEFTGSSCPPSPQILIQLKNLKTSTNISTVTVDQGGLIYVE